MTLEEVKLIAVGALFALGLDLSAVVFRQLVLRVAGDIGLLILAGLALYIFRLTIDGDPMDFLAVDLGIVLVAGAFGLGGLIPPALSPHGELPHPLDRNRKKPPPGSR